MMMHVHLSNRRSTALLMGQGMVPAPPPAWPMTVRPPQARTRELESLQQTVEELQAQVHSMDGAKGWFERRLKEAEVSWGPVREAQGLVRGHEKPGDKEWSGLGTF